MIHHLDFSELLCTIGKPYTPSVLMMVSGIFSEQPNPQKYRFAPTDKITAHELAQLLPLLAAAWQDVDVDMLMSRGELPEWANPKIEALPDHLRRHFVQGL
ncbi:MULTISPECIES: hypothetical protein [unclassified Leptolyngbya]|uniref:hypothetical protein n=1 Tax=unclassified Leptolyngbya TaxID=2650499 RepID=UPI001682BDA0|nr:MULTISPECIES: hypothetical protein [unclassified Leptolyngbya]MBD1909174.1 hypothetical protein [Leptolyngbya sp. FACHB-8]MBD2158445.1 hypothetical protein [Leptolyngbya sp. FACHB-16]